MSGLELVGVVLGAIPILVKVVEGRGQASQSSRHFFRKRLYVKRLANALYGHNDQLTATVKLLLTRCGYEHVSMDNNLAASLERDDIREHLEECLGQEKFSVFLENLADTVNIINDMTKNLEGLVAPQGQTTNNLYAIIEASKVSRGLDVISRLKFVSHASSMKKTTEELDALTSKLEQFVQNNLPSVDGPSPRGNVSPKAKRIAKGLIKVHNHMRSLHAAIRSGWTGDCHSAHETKLILDDHLESHVVSPKCGQSVDKCHLLKFRLALAPSNPLEGSAALETSVLVVEEDEDRTPPGFAPHDLDQTLARVTIQAPPRTAGHSNITPVQNICITIASANSTRPCFSFVLTSGSHLGIMSTTEKRSTQPFDDSITLQEILRSRAQYGRDMAQRSRMRLALQLSSSLLQLSRTPWLIGRWSSKTICFPLFPGASRNPVSRTDFTRPFISSIFAENHNTPSSQDDVQPEVAFLELGLMLLEIWHHQPIEAYFAGETMPEEYWARVALARRWRRESTDTPLDYYEQAIRHCIFGLIDQKSSPQWDDRQMWSSFCEEVIEPLNKNCKRW